MSLPCSNAEIRVYDRDATTLRGTIAADGLQWLDPLGEVGSANLTATMLQAAFDTDPDLLNEAVVKLATDLVPGDPLVEVYGFIAEGGEYTVISDAEEAGKERSMQCRGLLAFLDDWVVYPEIGLTEQAGDERTFGWMCAEDTTWWYDAADWSGSINAKKWSDVSANQDRHGKPEGWPDPDAYWVGVNDKLKQYFRAKVTVSENTPVKVFCSADEHLHVYLDSELIIKNTSQEVGYTELNEWRGVLTPGTHQFGIKFRKQFDPATNANWNGVGWNYDDKDKMIFSCWSVHPNGDLDTVLRRSANTSQWKAVGRDAGDRPPTWTAAGIVGKLLEEADGRGVQSAGRLVLDFDIVDDSAGNPWSEVDKHERQWSVGAKGTQVIETLGELSADFDITPDLHLKAYIEQGSDLSATVALQAGVNVLSYRIADLPVIATTLIVRGDDGWVEVTSAAEETTDRREGFLSAGDSLSTEQAERTAEQALEDLAANHRTAVAEIIAVDGCVPYLDFGKGDTIMALNKAREPVPRRVVSIAGTVPVDGPLRFTLELEEL